MKKLLLTGIVIAGILASCKKDNVPGQPSPQEQATTKKISKSVYIYNNEPAEVEQLTYDAAGRPATYTNDSKKEVFDFKSPTKLLVTRYKLSDNSIESTIDCTLNDKGAITKMEFKNLAGTITYTYEFQYNAEGYTTSIKGYNNSSSFEETIEVNNGNYTAAKRSYNGVLTYNDIYLRTSYTNTIPGGFFAYWPVNNLFGKASKNLCAETKSVKLNGDISNNNKYNYNRDASGTVLSYSIDFLTDGAKGNYAFTYE